MTGRIEHVLETNLEPLYLASTSSFSRRSTPRSQPQQCRSETVSKALFAHVIPTKGAAAEYEWTAKQLVQDIAKMGYGKVVIRSDQEPAITALVDKIKEIREWETLVEWAPRGDERQRTG